MAELTTRTPASIHHEEEHIHLPAPSIWPLIVALSAGSLPAGLLTYLYGKPALGLSMLAVSGVLLLISSVGWCTSVIKEKAEIDAAWGNRSLSLGWKLFLASEAAIFSAFFGHYFYLYYHGPLAGHAWPPAGTPHIHLHIPAIGTAILVTSSVTCELGHKALLRGKRSLSKSWIGVTVLLGFLFIALQGYEWGYLQTAENFYPSSNIIGTLFYLITGFHGAHVITGLLLLFLVYSRLEMGSFDRKRHFSMNAASWYWHFVDVIWICVFLFFYVGIQGAGE